MMRGVGAAAGEQNDQKHKRTAFRCNAHFYGVQDRCGFSCSIFAPHADAPDRTEMASFRGRMGRHAASP